MLYKSRVVTREDYSSSETDTKQMTYFGRLDLATKEFFHTWYERIQYWQEIYANCLVTIMFSH